MTMTSKRRRKKANEKGETIETAKENGVLERSEVMSAFRNLVVVVTGAARGIGFAVAAGYAREGARVVLADNRAEALEEAAEGLKRTGAESLAFPADVRREEDVIRLMKEVEERFGAIHILVNNAGVSRFQSPYELRVEEWDDILNTNLRGAFLCAREAARLMKKGGGGCIVNIASTRALMSEPDSEAYAASKAGLIGLTHALAVSLAPDRIRVNAISPGWIETGDYGALRPEDHHQHPAGRVGKPDDVVKACFYLTDPANDFVTGVNLVVDGGMTRKMIYLE
jgi:NAD(P)-dependent dehydrogenase (short-subunit alcohol dehydrogenase family)